MKANASSTDDKVTRKATAKKTTKKVASRSKAGMKSTLNKRVAKCEKQMIHVDSKGSFSIRMGGDVLPLEPRRLVGRFEDFVNSFRPYSVRVERTNPAV